MMKEKQMDILLVPVGLLAMSAYNCWLLFAIIHTPRRTVIGLNAEARRRWVRAIMSDQMKNGVLAVQTVRNNIMASTVLATTAITLASLISVFVSATTTEKSPSSVLVYGSKSAVASSVKFFSISLCYIVAFLCNVQSIRYYAHASFLITVPLKKESGSGLWIEYVARSINRGSYFWSLGMRAFYLSFTLFLWIFGPIPMLASSIIMCCLLYFLDTTTEYSRALHDLVKEDEVKENV